MENIILIVHVLLALAVIGLVLLQQGKGADAGASFGGGASQTVFGSQGSGNFLTRTTAILATAFFVTSFALAIYAKQKATEQADVGLPDSVLVEEQQKIVEPELPLDEDDRSLPQGDLPAVESGGTDLPKVD